MTRDVPCTLIRAALTTHELEWLEPWGKLAELELKCSNRELVYVGNTNVTQSTLHPLLTYTTAYRCHAFFTISNVYIQAVLSVILTFVLRQHVLELNEYSNVNKSPPINIYFLIAGLENKYFLGKLERPWAHELTSQTGGELMSWSPSVSAALTLIIEFYNLWILYSL